MTEEVGISVYEKQICCRVMKALPMGYKNLRARVTTEWKIRNEIFTDPASFTFLH